MTMERLVSIVLPVYRQADHIGRVVQEYEEALSRVPYSHESILVVNGGGDHSLEVCRALADQYETVQMICSEQAGWGRAVKLGLQKARGGLLCYTNSARTAASDLMLLIPYAVANPGTIVKAHRRSRESLERKLGSFLYNLECRALFDLPTWDVNATPKVFPRDVYNAIQPKSDGDLIDLEFYIKCKQLDIVILEVQIYSRSRHGGKPTTNYRSAVRMYWGAFQMWRAMRTRAKESRMANGTAV
jgi:glycosyltransferase involved in cell wall biosynthesis